MQWGAANHMRFACVVCSLHVVYRVLATLRCDGSVAQRMRASVSGTEGRGFESLQAHFCHVSRHRSGVLAHFVLFFALVCVKISFRFCL